MPMLSPAAHSTTLASPKPAPKRAVLVVNARSRRGEAVFNDARQKLEAAGITLTAAHAVRDPSKMRGIVRAAVESGTPMVIVGGGDGSLSGVVDDVVGSDCVFAVLPLGTANSFARSLGLPLDLDGAIATIATGQCRRIDLGMIGDDYFANAASLGLAPVIAETVPHGLKRYLGRVGYLVWALRCFFRFSAFQLTITVDQKAHRMWATEVRIFNGAFHGGVELSDTVAVDSGDITVQAVTGQSRWRLSWDWYAKFFKLRSRHATSEEFCGKTLHIATVPRQRISIDGEILAYTPVTIRVAEAAIEVVVPADASTAPPAA